MLDISACGTAKKKDARLDVTFLGGEGEISPKVSAVRSYKKILRAFLYFTHFADTRMCHVVSPAS